MNSVVFDMNIDGIEHITLADIKEMRRILNLPYFDGRPQMDKYLKDLNLTLEQGKKLKSITCQLRWEDS